MLPPQYSSGETRLMMLKQGEKPRVVGYLCEWCVADASSKQWQPKIGDKVSLCPAHADILKKGVE